MRGKRRCVAKGRWIERDSLLGGLEWDDHFFGVIISVSA